MGLNRISIRRKGLSNSGKCRKGRGVKKKSREALTLMAVGL
jgi:hypothetical protein